MVILGDYSRGDFALRRLLAFLKANSDEPKREVSHILDWAVNNELLQNMMKGEEPQHPPLQCLRLPQRLLQQKKMLAELMQDLSLYPHHHRQEENERELQEIDVGLEEKFLGANLLHDV